MKHFPEKLEMVGSVEYIWPVDQNVKFSSDIDQTKYICTCGSTTTRPYCDGSHQAINKDDDDLIGEVSKPENMDAAS